jgi:hypothetical protein
MDSLRLQHLNLSNAGLSTNTLLMIPKTLIANRHCLLQRLDLSGNFKLSHVGKKVIVNNKVIEVKPSMCQEFILKIGEYLNHDSNDPEHFNPRSLIQLNLSNMNL